MSHHGGADQMDPEFLAKAREMMTGLGPTGEFPEGKLTKSDEGGIRIAIGVKDGKVVIDFGSQVTWIGFTPAQAIDIANALMERANECTR